MVSNLSGSYFAVNRSHVAKTRLVLRCPWLRFPHYYCRSYITTGTRGGDNYHNERTCSSQVVARRAMIMKRVSNPFLCYDVHDSRSKRQIIRAARSRRFCCWWSMNNNRSTPNEIWFVRSISRLIPTTMVPRAIYWLFVRRLSLVSVEIFNLLLRW